MPAGLQDLRDTFGLSAGRGRSGGFHQLCKPQDRVQRATQFMTHAGKKIRLGEVCFFGGGLGAFEFEFEAFAVGHVAGRGKHALEFAIAIVKGGGVVGDDRLLSVARAGGEFVVGEFFCR